MLREKACVFWWKDGKGRNGQVAMHQRNMGNSMLKVTVGRFKRQNFEAGAEP